MDGHLFLLLEGEGALSAPDRVPQTVPHRHPGETAFVLGRGDAGEPWRYLGVGRWVETEGAWATPEVDFATWRTLGNGRSASRRLEERWNEKARELVGQLLADPGPGGWAGTGDRRCRIVGPAPGGGVRIDGGEGGFAERTVSLTDIAWVLGASERSAGTGAFGVLDQSAGITPRIGLEERCGRPAPSPAPVVREAEDDRSGRREDRRGNDRDPRP